MWCGWCIALLVLVCVAFNWLLRRPRVGGYYDKHVLITGCDRGFGSMLAKRLDRLGFHVFATCLTEKGCQDMKAACSDRLTALQMDIASSASIKQAYNTIKDLLAPNNCLWAVVNNAGICGPAVPSEWMTRADFQQVLDVNLLGTIEVTNTFLPMVKNAKGRVVNVSSIGGRFTEINTGCYCISKYGIQSYSDGLRKMMLPFGVYVSIIEPAFYRTGIVSPEVNIKEIERVWSKLPQDLKESYGERYKNSNIKMIKSLEKLASDKIYLVTDAMEHAITARWPKSRYLVGLSTKLLLVPYAMLPSFMSDFLVSTFLKRPIPEQCRK